MLAPRPHIFSVRGQIVVRITSSIIHSSTAVNNAFALEESENKLQSLAELHHSAQLGLLVR